ncbi:MAG: hypothetical protein SV422_13205, partial [Pseudomonadota bacterium]|nr:hypothetical protein [Pseudomonadota bacterium]
MPDINKPRNRTAVGRGPRVLLAWELGEGFGHAQRLLALAQLLRNAGWTPLVAARDPHALADQYAAAAITVIQAPGHHTSFAGPERFRATTFADMMGVCGYAELPRLEHMMRTWDAVLDEHRPDLIIADYSPLLSLAAFGRVPLVAIGDGFVTPPAMADGGFPAMGKVMPPVWEPAVLLENARQVQKWRGLRLPESLPQIMSGAGQITSVPRELDIYAHVRRTPAAGYWEPAPPPLPASAPPRFFAYLRLDKPLARRLLDTLIALRLPGECFVHGAPPRLVAALEGAGITVHRQPPPLRDALARHSLLIHHGGIGTLTEGLAAGRPQLLLPRHLEQELNTQRALAIGAGIFGLARNADMENVKARLPDLLTHAHAQAAANTVATRIHERGDNAWDSLQRLLARIDAATQTPTAVAVPEDDYARGNRLHRAGRLAEAIAIYDSILQRDAEHIGARADRANARRDLGDFAGAEDDMRGLVEKHPQDAVLLQSLGQLLRIAGRPEEALVYLEQALALKPTPQLHWQLAYTFLLLGRFTAAWPHFEHRHAALGLRTAHPAKPRWDGTAVTQSTLLVLDEQGIGDTLQFLRFLPLIPRGPGARIIFAGKPAVLPLVESMLQPADVFSWDGSLPHSQAWVPLMSLPMVLGIDTPDALPPPATMPADALRVARWRAIVKADSRMPVVALCWRGNPDFTGDAWRSPGLAALLPLLTVPGLRFVS